MDFYSGSSLKQQSTGRHVSPLAHIILIPSQSVFDIFPYCCVLRSEAANNLFIVFGINRLGLKPTIYRTGNEQANHYTTGVLFICHFKFLTLVFDIQLCYLITLLDQELSDQFH